MRCQFCRRSDGVLVYSPPSPDYVGPRRGYRQIGMGPSRYHQDCLEDFADFEYQSEQRTKREREEQNALLREALEKMREGQP